MTTAARINLQRGIPEDRRFEHTTYTAESALDSYVLARVNAISNSMNRHNQNGANHDVISAIDKLRGVIGNMSNTTYQVNGITYDDGSNVSGAVAQLVRAAKIGRRV